MLVIGIPSTLVAGAAEVSPPQPEIYTFSQVSTRNATGEIFALDTLLPLPYTVE
ncbi:hypothetical protein D3C80_1205600 [compost metagenome]